MSDVLPSDSPSAPDASGASAALIGHRHEFSATLEQFQGPLDLLLYLIKEDELEITAIPIARILQQYLGFLDQATQWDLQMAGEFLVMATTLMEIKSRGLLPREQALSGDEIIEDPRSELVRQLLRYRTLKDQARNLEEHREAWCRRYPRGMLDEVPEAEAESAGIDPGEIAFDLYDLLVAYEKLRREVLMQAPRELSYEGESLEQKIERIEKLLAERPFTRFAEMVGEETERAEIAMTFVALLELVRRRMIRIVQGSEFGDIEVKVQTPEEAEEVARRESQSAGEVVDVALREKAEREQKLLEQAEAMGVEASKLPWKVRRAILKRPRFETTIKPEDLEEIDAEEAEIGRRIDAILAAADAITQRFEDSRGGTNLPAAEEVAASAPQSDAPLTEADLEPRPEPPPRDEPAQPDEDPAAQDDASSEPPSAAEPSPA